jgi:hypothetical protein
MDHKARHKKEREVFKDFKAFLLKQNALAPRAAVPAPGPCPLSRRERGRGEGGPIRRPARFLG